MTKAHAKAATSPSPGTERGICLNIHENPPATSDPSPDTRAGHTQVILQQTTQCRQKGWMYRAINAVILFSKLSDLKVESILYPVYYILYHFRKGISCRKNPSV